MTTRSRRSAEATARVPREVEARATVLIVEDDPSVMRMLRFAMESAGFAVLEAGTGQEGLSALRRGGMDAVVLDPGLPDDLGGVVLERLRQSKAGVGGSPVWMVVSALDREEAVGRYGPVGDHFLAKPFNPWDLARRLEELLDARSGKRDARP